MRIFLVAVLLIVVYLAIPREMQTSVQQALLTGGQVIASLGPVMPLAGIAALLTLLTFAAIFVRPYRRATYLATTPSAIPLISVYVDAENQLTNVAVIPQFTQEVMEHLNGRRADLFFFMDASSKEHGAQTEQFKTLYRYGFQPVHVPHNPTGKAKKGVKEAVDKELAMHAHERALLGPPNQEFIIVTGDQDFVALVYRLAALGHHVQVWATPILPAYRALATYLDIELVDIARLVSESGPSARDNSEDRRETETERGDGASADGRTRASDDIDDLSYEAAEPTLLSEAGEKQLYRAIMQTLGARDKCERRAYTQAQSLSTFRGMLGGELASRLASVGYRAGGKIDYWLDHLYATGVLKQVQKDHLPIPGSTSPEKAAHAWFVVAQLAADAAIAAGHEHADGIISMTDLANALLPQQAQALGSIRSLLDLIARSNGKRAGHARYFVRCAQALGLVEFDDVRRSPDVIRTPHLIGTLSSDAPSADGTAEPATRAGDGTNEIASAPASVNASSEKYEPLSDAAVVAQNDSGGDVV